jgi:small subunit ribosomal protein S4
MFLVNDKPLNIPSYLVKVGDVITLKPNKAKKKLFETITDQLVKKETASWLSLDSAKKTAKVVGMPSDKDFEKTFDIRLIIEFYSSR